MKLLLLLPLLLGFSVPANATSDLHPLDMKLEQEGFSSLIAQEPAGNDPECEREDESEGMSQAEINEDCEA